MNTPTAIRVIRHLIILPLLLFVAIPTSWQTGQRLQGSEDLVYDESGKPIEVATIALSNTATGFATTTTTDKKGYFDLRDLP